MFGKEKKCYDGYLVKKLDPVVLLMPYIMPRRTDSESKVDLRLDLTKVEQFVREHHEDIPGLTLYHVVFATIVRAAAETPEINRFIAGNRIYQRRTVRISMMIKKHLEVNGRESTIFPVFNTTDTLAEIVQKTNTLAEEALAQLDDDSNGFDRFVSLLYAVPPFLLRGFIGFMMFLDRYGKLPKKLCDLQPFHSGFFVTNVGSIGLPVIYHHLYEFGTTSMFVSIGKKELKMGIRGSATCELIFENCEVPKENLLGQLGKGFSIAMKTLDGGRIGIASQALGIAQGAMDETVKYTKERKQFGKAIAQFQNTQFQMADLKTKVEAARFLVRSAAWKKDNGIPYSADAAMAKLFAAETAMEVTTKAVQFHGGYGYTREYPVERMMRDAKITEIYEGTSEVQRMVIAGHLFK